MATHLHLGFFLLCFVIYPARSSHEFYFSRFSNNTNPSFNGVARIESNTIIKLTNETRRQLGHGMVFAIASSKDLPDTLPSQYLSLFNSTDNGNFSNHIFVVEFDTVQDFEFKDINDNHVDIDINSMVSNVSIAAGFYFDDNPVFCCADFHHSTHIHEAHVSVRKCNF